MPRGALSLVALVAGLVGLVAFTLVLGGGLLARDGAWASAFLALLLLTLPPLGLASLFRERLPGFLLGLLLWSAGVVATASWYWPGRRAEAFQEGLGALAGAVGLAAPAHLGWHLDAMLPDLFPAAAPPAEPAVVLAEPPPAPTARGLPAAEAIALLQAGGEIPSEVVLPFSNTENSLLVPVTLERASGMDREVRMIFDTGATLTTLDRRTLHMVGVEPSRTAPHLRVQTASGERTVSLALLDRVWLGGFEVDDVTVGVCDECAFDSAVGLLGNNVLGRFRSTVDQVHHEIVLDQEDRARVDRTLDILPWVELELTATRWPTGRTVVELSARNHAPRRLDWALVAIECGEKQTVRLESVEPGQVDTAAATFPPGTRCIEPKARLERAAW